MFGEACKGGILLFFSLEGNSATVSKSVGAGYAGSLPSEEPAGYAGSDTLRLPGRILSNHCGT